VHITFWSFLLRLWTICICKKRKTYIRSTEIRISALIWFCNNKSREEMGFTRFLWKLQDNFNTIIVIFILSAWRECFLCMKRSFTPRRRSRQYKPLNAQKTSSRTKYKQYFFYNWFKKLKLKIQIFEGTLKFQCSDHVAR
jgi:hypothetical protein